MSSRRVLILLHPRFVPRPNATGTEADVCRALKKLGHQVELAALTHDWRRFDRELVRLRPHVVFNLLEEYRGEAVYDFHPVSYLEALGIPFTGCNPRALALTRNKLWTMQLGQAAGAVVPETRLYPARVAYPAFLKFNREHASLGVTRANRVRSDRERERAAERMRTRYAGELVVQEFIAGHEITVSACGHARPEVFAPWRLCLPTAEDVATTAVKFSARFRQRKAIRAVRWRGAGAAALIRQTRTLYRHFDLSGYARFDYRVTAAGSAYLIDVNANPSLAKAEDFAMSSGRAYPDLIARVLQLALEYRPRI